MTKRYANAAFFYAILAMAAGVFYREYTRFQNFTGQTRLSVLHTHYFLLGMVFFLLLLVIEKVLAFSDAAAGKLIVCYHIGLNITGLAFLLRGLVQISVANPGRGIDASISGVAGIGHILMGISLALILWKIKKRVGESR